MDTCEEILDGFQGRQPNFHKWARPAYEQGALPTLSLLPGEVVIKVLPGDKIYQAMEIEQGFMRPAILHGFGTSAKQRLPSRLAEFGAIWVATACGSSIWHSRLAAAMATPQFSPCHWLTCSCENPTVPALLSADRGIAWSV